MTLSGANRDDEVMIQVADTGTGIAPDDLDRVFEHLWRTDRSRTRQTGGSGLGPTIVRRPTRAHGGTVTADSVPGEGPVFPLRLPVTVADRRPHG